jgi:hypothetical protein
LNLQSNDKDDGGGWSVISLDLPAWQHNFTINRAKLRITKSDSMPLPELADNHCNNQKHQHRDDRNGDHLVRSHPERRKSPSA